MHKMLDGKDLACGNIGLWHCFLNYEPLKNKISLENKGEDLEYCFLHCIFCF